MTGSCKSSRKLLRIAPLVTRSAFAFPLSTNGSHFNDVRASRNQSNSGDTRESRSACGEGNRFRSGGNLSGGRSGGIRTSSELAGTELRRPDAVHAPPRGCVPASRRCFARHEKRHRDGFELSRRDEQRRVECPVIGPRCSDKLGERTSRQLRERHGRLSRRDPSNAEAAWRGVARSCARMSDSTSRRHGSAAGTRLRKDRRTRLVRQEHDADQQTGRKLAVSRSVADRRRAGAGLAARHFPLRNLHALSGSLPDRRVCGSVRARRAKVHFLSDDRVAGSADSARTSRRHAGLGFWLRRLPGCLPVEPQSEQHFCARVSACR